MIGRLQVSIVMVAPMNVCTYKDHGQFLAW